MEVVIVMDMVVLKVTIEAVVVEADVQMDVVEDLLMEDLICFGMYHPLDVDHLSFRTISRVLGTCCLKLS